MTQIRRLFSDLPSAMLRKLGDWRPDMSDDERLHGAMVTPLTERCMVLAGMPLNEFCLEDLRLLIGQGIAVDRLVPHALDVLMNNPLVDVTFFEGNLLESVLRIDRAFWKQRSQLADALWRTLDMLEHKTVQV